jgi:hypothetical protein
MKNIKNQIGIDIIRIVIKSPNIVMFVYIQKTEGGNLKLPPRAKVWVKIIRTIKLYYITISLKVKKYVFYTGVPVLAFHNFNFIYKIFRWLISSTFIYGKCFQMSKGKG